jgi:hypothetical protein
MPSSTSSSRVEPVYERPVASVGRAGWIALLLAVLLVAWFEAWVRAQGVSPDGYLNSPGAWAEQRRRINQGEGDAWVFIGSSRIKFNSQMPVWERLDPRPTIMLALEGTSPMTVLEGLADDPDFTGTVLVGVAPGLFFSGFEMQRSAIDRFENETPSQWLGHKLSILAEPRLAFYEDYFSLATILARQKLPEREGTEFELDVPKLASQDRRRNTRMWDRLEYDEDYRELSRFVWAQGWKPFAERPPEQQEQLIESRGKQIERAVSAVEKLRARGVETVFVVMPYEGHYAVSVPDFAPRELTWDILIEKTGALGLHFEDHEEMQGYYLPEWSHMSAAEADRFTEAFYHLVQRRLAEHQAQGASQ